MAEVHGTRRNRLRERCAATGIDAALVTRPANVLYLTGSAPPGAALLAGPGPDDTLVHRRPPPDDPGEPGERGDRSTDRLPEDLRSTTLPTPDGDAAVAAADLARERQAERLAVEEHHLTVARHRA